MKTSQTKADKTLRFKPLSIEQRNAIDLLIVGKSDQETADAVGMTRQTIHA
jgi:DNA-binding CsgD family transcriptional regulator